VTDYKPILYLETEEPVPVTVPCDGGELVDNLRCVNGDLVSILGAGSNGLSQRIGKCGICHGTGKRPALATIRVPVFCCATDDGFNDYEVVGREDIRSISKFDNPSRALLQLIISRIESGETVPGVEVNYDTTR